jgi:ribosome-associated protein
MSSPESIRVNRRLAIPLAEIELRFSRSSGPGGQHAQKTETRVEAVFDVEASATLTDAQKRRLLARAGPVVRAVAQDERSQWRNRETALERLAAALASGLATRRPRKPTAPTAASREQRLTGKRRRAAVKRLRRPPDEA